MTLWDFVVIALIVCRLTFQPENITYMNFCFRINFLKSYISFTYMFFSGIDFPKIVLKHVFVCDSENYLEKLTWDYFLGEIASQLHKISFRN